VRWSGVGRMNGSGPRGGANDRHVEQADAGLETPGMASTVEGGASKVLYKGLALCRGVFTM